MNRSDLGFSCPCRSVAVGEHRTSARGMGWCSSMGRGDSEHEHEMVVGMCGPPRYGVHVVRASLPLVRARARRWSHGPHTYRTWAKW